MSEGKLTVTDSRTSREYEIPIHRNVIDAAKFKAIRAPAEGTDLADQVKNGIRLYDPGLRNTATAESKLTFRYVSVLCKTVRSSATSYLSFVRSTAIPAECCNIGVFQSRNFSITTMKTSSIWSFGVVYPHQKRRKD